jgi:hypothetical protein
MERNEENGFAVKGIWGYLIFHSSLKVARGSLIK